MNSVTKKLRCDLIANVRAALEVSQKIQSLKWAEGSLPEVQKIRSVKDESGHKVNGRRALKPYLRPETGPERSILWGKKRSLGWTTRDYLLVYAMLRGKPYKAVEKNCAENFGPSVYGMNHVIRKYFEEGKCPITEEQIIGWLNGEAAPTLEEAA